MTVGERIRNIRIEKGFTQKGLAEKAKVSISSLQLYEYGKRSPDVETVKKLADAMGVSILRILCDSFRDVFLEFTISIPEEALENYLLFCSFNEIERCKVEGQRYDINEIVKSFVDDLTNIAFEKPELFIWSNNGADYLAFLKALTDSGKYDEYKKVESTVDSYLHEIKDIFPLYEEVLRDIELKIQDFVIECIEEGVLPEDVAKEAAARRKYVQTHKASKARRVEIDRTVPALDPRDTTVLTFNIDSPEGHLFVAFDTLNETGQQEAVKRVEELTQIPKYTTPENTENEKEEPEPLRLEDSGLMAAHNDNNDPDQMEKMKRDLDMLGKLQ